MFPHPCSGQVLAAASAVLLLGSTDGRDKPDVSHPLRPTTDRDDARTRDLDQAERDHERDEAFDLLARAGDLKAETLGRRVDHAASERIADPNRLHTLLSLA